MNPVAEWVFATRRVGRRVLVLNQTGSTNDEALRHAQNPSQDGLAILAREQTAGRGQHGRTWQAPPESSVLLSVLVFPPALVSRPVLMTAWAAVAVCRTIEHLLGVIPRIKWPNDVLLEGRKIAGILIEQRQGVVAGIGLNVNQTAEMFAAARLPCAVSLAMWKGQPFAWSEVAQDLLRVLDEEFQRLTRGDSLGLEASWRHRLDLAGRKVLAECHNESTHEGTLHQLSFSQVEIATVEGPTLRLPPEAIRHLTPL